MGNGGAGDGYLTNAKILESQLNFYSALIRFNSRAWRLVNSFPSK